VSLGAHEAYAAGMGLLDSVKKLTKNKDAILKTKDKIVQGVDKATDFVDKKTGGKYADKLKKVDEAAAKLGDKSGDKNVGDTNVGDTNVGGRPSDPTPES
jgi:hypothetical protein